MTDRDAADDRGRGGAGTTAAARTAVGAPASQEPYVQLPDTRKLRKKRAANIKHHSWPRSRRGARLLV